jgi:nudix-type nucleoside diphosphatase (YffH/AdpP family)
MPSYVKIIHEKQVFSRSIFRIIRVKLQHEKYDGSRTPVITRLVLERGDSVAAVIHDPQADTVILTEQFRYPTYHKGPGWILELPAGMVEAGEDPAVTMQRELVEEVGYTVNSLKHINTFYLSPGGTSERILLYYANALPTQQTTAGGGLDDEGEDIRRIIMPVDEALAKIASGEIIDAKTIIGLQWLQLNRRS